ncbi:MAG: MBL fold metallo-hydrolase, partial [Myxococcales bacterium]|nr:MBL fold metallo-hydrolase [Myxococcales bacterium]
MDIPAFESDAKGRPTEVVGFETRSGVEIFLLPVETFPGHRNNLYLILADGAETLFDVGSPLPAAKAELAARFEELRSRYGIAFTPSDLKRVVVSHAHIDH